MELPKDFFLYTTVTKAQSEEMLTQTNPITLRNLLRTLFITDPHDDKNDIMLDFYSHHIHFAKQHNFSLEKLSCFLGIMDFIFHSSLHFKLQPSAAFEAFKRILDRHSIQRPPYSIMIFSPEDRTLLTEYVVHTFFKHYLLYQYAFTPQNDIFITASSPFPEKLPNCLALTVGKEFQATEVPILEEYLEQSERQISEQSQSEEIKQEDSISDPVHLLFMQEMMSLKKDLNDNIKKQDEVLISKLETHIKGR
jgi:hypothetical protein